MSTILEIPKLPSTVVLDPPLTDEEFETLCAANDFARLERTTEGTIVVNAPAGADTSSGNSEIKLPARGLVEISIVEVGSSTQVQGSSFLTVRLSARMRLTRRQSRCAG